MVEQVAAFWGGMGCKEVGWGIGLRDEHASPKCSS